MEELYRDDPFRGGAVTRAERTPAFNNNASLH